MADKVTGVMGQAYTKCRAFFGRRVMVKIGLRAGLLVCVSLSLAPFAHSQDERGPGLPEGNGKQLTAMVCSQCHGLKEIEILRDGQPGWKDTVDRMVLYGAQLSPSEADLVTRYLATQLGPDKGAVAEGASTRDNTTQAQSMPGNAAMKITLPAGPGRELVAARCVLCHGIVKAVGTPRSKADWESITHNMVERGMQATPDEIRVIIAYLQTNFPADPGTDKASLPANRETHAAALSGGRIAVVSKLRRAINFSPNTPASPQPDEQTIRAGNAIFLQRCFQCHSVQPGDVRFGPSLYGEIKKPHPKISAAQFRAIVRDGRGKMPAFGHVLSQQDTDDLLAYVHSL